jgi:phosphomannomutase
MAGLSTALKAKVEAWIAADPDDADRSRLEADLAAAEQSDAEAIQQLTAAFAQPLVFGTAGLRGELGPGPGRMNRAVVIRTTAGLMSYLLDVTGQATATKPGVGGPTRPGDQIGQQAIARATRRAPAKPVKVVIGYDARHGSAQFAKDTAAVVVAAGGRALLWDQTCPTPLLAYAVRLLKAEAGVMVTASHNPARDNGYKVYLGGRAAWGPADGVQIASPADTEIAARITQAPNANAVPRANRGWETIGPDLEREYLSRVIEYIVPAPGADNLRIVHTAMHGVGSRIALAAFRSAGFTDIHSVSSQLAPDPDFPTVAFPNPEEPGAIDLAAAQAEIIGADLVIAHDPDADRCAVCVYDPRFRGGNWRMLTGDEVGALLGDDAARSYLARPLADDAAQPTLAASVVSSRLLARIAREHLLRYTRTLTGFKWIARVPGLIFGYEEAIGYCTRPDLVRDKDGISAGLAISRIAARTKLSDRSLIDLLDDLARRHGLHATAQVSLPLAGSSSPAELMRRLRRSAPAQIGPAEVTRVTDLLTGWESLAATDALIFTLKDSARIVVRPSGTEPKIKCYLEVVLPVPSTASFTALTAIRADAAAQLAVLGAAVKSLFE